MSYPFVWDFTSSLWKVAGFWSDLMHAYQRTVKKICLYIRYLLCLFWAVKSNLTYLFTEWDRSIPQWITQRSLGILPKSTGRSSNWKCIYVCIMHINFWGDCLLFQGYKVIQGIILLPCLYHMQNVKITVEHPVLWTNIVFA